MRELILILINYKVASLLANVKILHQYLQFSVCLLYYTHYYEFIRICMIVKRSKNNRTTVYADRPTQLYTLSPDKVRFIKSDLYKTLELHSKVNIEYRVSR